MSVYGCSPSIPDPLSVRLSMHNKTFNEGAVMTLTCIVESGRADRLEWLKDDRKLQESGRLKLTGIVTDHDAGIG